MKRTILRAMALLAMRAAVLAAVLAAAVPGLARAHGGGVPQVTAAPAGAYLLYVWTDPAAPRAGDALHVTVAVTLPAQDGNETPVTDAAVRVQLHPGGEGAAIDLEAAPGAAAGGVYYEADAVLPQGGDWQVRVYVSGAEGAGEAQFALAVAESPGLPWGWMVVIVMLVAALAIFLLLLLRWSPRRARQETVRQ